MGNFLSSAHSWLLLPLLLPHPPSYWAHLADEVETESLHKKDKKRRDRKEREEKGRAQVSSFEGRRNESEGK